MKQFAVIGAPVAHSRSPQMHNAAFRSMNMDARYIAIRVEKDDLPSFIREAKKYLSGFNVTVPHKNNILPFLDEIDPVAALAGSVNTVTVHPDGRLSGTSTDGYGLETAVREAGGPVFQNAVICFIGCGGVVPALAFHAASAGAKEIRILNRTAEKASQLADKLASHHSGLKTVGSGMDSAEGFLRGTDLIVQCTSLGLKVNDPAPVSPELLPAGTFFFDIIYRNTKLIEYAEAHRIPCADGLGMLLHQGAKSFSIWTGSQAPLDIMRQALKKSDKEQVHGT